MLQQTVKNPSITMCKLLAVSEFTSNRRKSFEFCL